MKTVLQINSGMQGENSQSSILANKIIGTLHAIDPTIKHTKRDLSNLNIQHLNFETYETFSDASSAMTTEQKTDLRLSNNLIAELKEADILVFGVSMYNLMIPSLLKSWIDYVVRAGETFQFSETGPVGLLNSKKAYIVIAQGGQTLGTPADFITDYLKTILDFIGITDIEFIYAQGLAMGKEIAEANLNKANQRIIELCDRQLRTEHG